MAVVRWVYRILEKAVLPFLIRRRSTPMQLTAAGLVASALAGLAFWFSPALGAILVLIGGLCDLLDGQLARRLSQGSPKGAFWDSVMDRYGEAFVFMGILAYLQRFPAYSPWSGVLVLAAMLGAFSVSYTRARGEGLGVSFPGGLFTRPERLLWIALGGLLNFLAPGLVLAAVMTILAVGANSAAWYRFARISRLLEGPGPVNPETGPSPGERA
jgi:CDP-diacylglycerol--glycerol-3-phosphate 3-phosphatidyltransferase